MQERPHITLAPEVKDNTIGVAHLLPLKRKRPSSHAQYKQIVENIKTLLRDDKFTEAQEDMDTLSPKLRKKIEPQLVELLENRIACGIAKEAEFIISNIPTDICRTLFLSGNGNIFKQFIRMYDLCGENFESSTKIFQIFLTKDLNYFGQLFTNGIISTLTSTPLNSFMHAAFAEAVRRIKKGEPEAITITNTSDAASLSEGQLSSNLLRVSLQDNMLGDTGVRHLSEFLKANTLLKTLILVGNKITKDGASFLASALINNESITYLDVSSNLFGVKGAGHMAKMLEINKVLRHLNIGFNQIKNTGLRSISTALRSNNTLVELCLARDDIVSEMGVEELSKTLLANNVLNRLDISNNLLGNRGIEKLCQHMDNFSLLSLDLRSTMMNDQSGEFLAVKLRTNSSLQVLNLAFNQISDAAAKNIVIAAIDHKSLQHLDLRENGLTEEGKSFIREIWQNRKSDNACQLNL